MNNEEKILAMLEKLTTDIADMKATQSEQGKQLAEQGDRLLKMEMNIEHTIIPRLDALHEGQQLLQETLARKESIEDVRDALTELEAATKASFTEVWNRVSKLEKAK